MQSRSYVPVDSRIPGKCVVRLLRHELAKVSGYVLRTGQPHQAGWWLNISHFRSSTNARKIHAIGKLYHDRDAYSTQHIH